MLLDKINPFRSITYSNELARRASIESPVTLLSVRQVSEHEAFGLGYASPATTRRSCWPTGADSPEASGMEGIMPSPAGQKDPLAVEPNLQAILAASALDAASPRALAINRHRLDLIDSHYRAVVEGEATLTDEAFTTTVMRPLMTWLQALSVLDEKTYDRCGQCARGLMSIVVSAQHGGHFTFRQLGTTDDLAEDLDGRAVATYFLEQIGPVLADFHDVVECKGIGSRVLAAAIGWMKCAPSAMTMAPRNAWAQGSASDLPYRAGSRPLPGTSRSLGDLRAIPSMPCLVPRPFSLR